MVDFIQGVKCALAGFRLLLRPSIRPYIVIPLLINALLFASAIAYGAHLLGDAIDLMAQWAWLKWLGWLLWPVFLIIALAAVFFGFTIIANLIGAPFNGLLANAVERTLTGHSVYEENKLPNPRIFIEAIKSETLKFRYFILRALPLLLLFIIPGVNIAAPLLWILFSAWMLAIEYSDYPMGNHGILFRQQRRRLASKWQAALGFGIGSMILIIIPVINFIAMPMAVIGATKMYLTHFKTDISNPDY